jgi:hypothetical protein
MLWNFHFASISDMLRTLEVTDAKFADDLTVFKAFPSNAGDHDIRQRMEHVQQRCHAWGHHHMVQFEPAKEHVLLLHRHASSLATFKLLGTTFDLRLRMDHCVNTILKKVRPKLKAVLRLKPYYDGPAMVQQFKTHVLGILEANLPAYYQPTTMPVAQFWLLLTAS